MAVIIGLCSELVIAVLQGVGNPCPHKHMAKHDEFSAKKDCEEVSWRNGSALASGSSLNRLPKAAGSSPADIDFAASSLRTGVHYFL